jgi:HEAT repeat protein
MRTLLSAMLLVVAGCAAAACAAEPTVAELMTALQAKDEAARVVAIDYLGMKGAKAAEAVPALAALLKDPSATVRAHAADALGKIGPAARGAAPALVVRVADEDPLVRRKAVMALRDIRPGPKVTVPLLTKLLEDGDPAVRHRALTALAEGGAEAVPRLVDALQFEKARYWICLVLREIGPGAKSAVGPLTDLLQDKQPEVRREAILALAEIGDAAAAPAIAKLLDDEHAKTAATFALGRLGKVTPEAEAKIRANAKSDDKMLVATSMWTLAKAHPQDKELLREAVGAMVEGLKSPEPRVRLASARGLAALEAGPDIVMPILEQHLEGADETVVMHALGALAKLGPVAVPRLLNALKHEKARPGVVYVLGEIGPDAKPAVAALVKLLDDPSEEVRHEVLIALGKIGAGAKEAVPALIKVLQGSEGPACYGAAYALGRIGPDAEAAKPALLKTLECKDESAVLLAAWAIALQCDDCAAKVVPILIQALSDPAPKYRAEAAAALKAFGSRAKAALPALKKATEDEDPQVRKSAAAAIVAIGS